MIGIAQISFRPPLCTLIIWLLSVAWLPNAYAEWTQTEKTLTAWNHSKTIDFIISGNDDGLVLESLELSQRLVSLGYQVTLGRHADAPASALELRLTVEDRTATLVLNRTRDGITISAEQRNLAEVTPSTVAIAPIAPIVPIAANKASLSRLRSAGNYVRDRSIDLNRQPVRIVSLNQSNPDILRVALLDATGLSVYDIDSTQALKPVAEFRPPNANLSGLYLDAGDIDADGHAEIVAVWGENNLSGFDGIDTKLHAWVFALNDGALRVVSDDLQGYLRINNNAAYFQQRGVYQPFSGPVYKLETHNGQFVAAKTPVLLGLGNIYQNTPIDNDSALSWDDSNRLVHLSGIAQSQTAAVDEAYSEALGEITFPVVYVKLEKQEYLLGFSVSDRVQEQAIPLARRVLMDGDTAYTQVRNRDTSLFKLNAEGADRIVAIDTRSGQMSEPFSAVSSFILDFTLSQGLNDSRVAILLLNDKADGSGKSSLRIQRYSVD